MSHASTESATQDLPARIRTFIAGASSEDFDGLALAAHAYQYRHNPPYRRLVDRLGAPSPRSWREIPAVPTTAFKQTVLACGPAARIFASSGTTQGAARRSHHHVPDLALYRAAALAGFQRAVLPAGERRRFIVAAPEGGSHPTSSLGAMISWLREAHDSGSTPSSLLADGLDYDDFARTLDAITPTEPVLLVALTAALLRLADHVRARSRRWSLPSGSLVLDTGGCKGYAKDLARVEVLARYRALLGVHPDQVINEYGMTEMCSQLYARGTGPLVPPPWVRTLIFDPITGDEPCSGGIGLLRHVDLANLGSVACVQTEDVGRAVDGGIELHGRLPDAEARGCSLLLATTP